MSSFAWYRATRRFREFALTLATTLVAPSGDRDRADDLHMIELECAVADRSPVVALPAPGLRDDTLRHRTGSAHASPQQPAFDLFRARRLSAARAVFGSRQRHRQLRA